MPHKFNVGDTVNYFGYTGYKTTKAAQFDLYEIVALHPGYNDDRQDPQYRLKRVGHSDERVVKESEIQPPGAQTDPA